MTKDNLLRNLAEPCNDPELAHARAEENLLAFVDDAEIKKAWNEAREIQNWWYA